MEIVRKVQQLMLVADMVAYGGVSHENYIAMHNAIVDHTKIAVGMFTQDYCAFMQMLDVHHAVISESTALWVFQPSMDWTPNDMDLYVPCLRVQGILHCLRGIGFVSVKRPDAIAHNSRYDKKRAVASVAKVTNGDVTIDVVESKSPSLFVPIFEFHMTAVMNFISADRFFSVYPSLTTKKRALMNPMRLYNEHPSAKTIQCYNVKMLKWLGGLRV